MAVSKTLGSSLPEKPSFTTVALKTSILDLMAICYTDHVRNDTSVRQNVIEWMLERLDSTVLAAGCHLKDAVSRLVWGQQSASVAGRTTIHRCWCLESVVTGFM